MSHTRAWNEASPAGTDLASTIDSSMRAMKVDVRERMSLEHVWNTSTTNDGKHANITLTVPANTAAISTATYSLTAANEQSLVDMAGTWNTSGNPVLVKYSLTKTAAGATSKLLEFLVDSASVFFLTPAGSIAMAGSLGATATRVVKGWFTDLEVTNAIAGSITGAAATAGTVTTASQPSITTCANLVSVGTIATGTWNAGPVTSSGAVSDSVGSMATIRAGGIGMTSQAQYDLVQASSASQLARIAGVALGVLKTDASKVPSILAGTALQSWRVNAAGTDVEAYTPTSGPMTLLKAGSGSSTAAGATNVDTVAISGLTALDRLLIVFQIGSATQATATVGLYHVTDSKTILDLGTLAANTQDVATFTYGVDPVTNTRLHGTGVTAFGDATTDSTLINHFPRGSVLNATTAWTGAWTLALRHGGVTAGGTCRWSWAVYKLAGQ